MSNYLWFLIKSLPVLVVSYFLVSPQTSAVAISKLESLSIQTPLNTPKQNVLVAQAAPGYVHPDEALGILKNHPTVELPGSVDLSQADPMAQVTSVSELRDVEPTAWAYEALRSLVERYGCIVGYPDRIFRGNKALSRWEFAAGLNACMNVMERLIQENVAVLRADIDTLARLLQEFEAELSALGTRVDNLESRVAFLEDHQFSTTTKLKGEVIFGLADSFGEPVVFERERQTDFFGSQVVSVRQRSDRDDQSQTVLQNRVRLNFDTTFTGKDLLRTRLQAGNAGGSNRFRQRGVTGTNMTRLGYDSGSNNDVTVHKLFYRTPIGDDFKLWVGANALDLNDVFPTANPYLASSGTGSISRLMRFNNMLYRGPQGTGAALQYDVGNNFYVAGTYLADDAANPEEGGGLFNGSFSGGSQVGYRGDSFEIGLGYVHSYRTADGPGIFGGITSNDADKPFGNVPTTADRYGISGNWDITEWLNFFGWFGYGNAVAQDTETSLQTAVFDFDGDGTTEFLSRDVVEVQRGDSVDLWTWNAGFNLIDLGKEGAVLTIGGGLPPKGDVEESSYIIQSQYKYPINKNILITPGFFVILNPNNDSNNDAIWMGVVRTTFKF